MNLQLKPRLTAFAIHLGISFVIFMVLAAIIRFIWYPGFLFTTDGGWQGIRLIAGVDLVIGPLLTLLVYNINKPGLKKDLRIIGLLQVSCLIAGMAAVHYNKPLAVVYADGSFRTLNKAAFENAGVSTDTPLLKQAKPVWLAVELPQDPQQKAQIIAAWEFFEGLAFATELYQPFEQALPELPHAGETVEGSQVIRKFPLQSLFTLNSSLLINTDSGEITELITSSDNRIF